MKKFFGLVVISMAFFSGVDHFILHPNSVMAISDSDIDKILKAKEIVRNMVNYPDTLVFHDLHTVVNGNTVTLKFSCKNGYGVSETHIMDIKVK
jgi:hypothetical protein